MSTSALEKIENCLTDWVTSVEIFDYPVYYEDIDCIFKNKNVSVKLIRILLNDGWIFQYQKGSHRMFKHPVKPGKISVPCRCSRNILMSVLRQAGLNKKELNL